MASNSNKCSGALTYDGMRAVMRWSPTGVVIYKTEAGGWSVKKDSAVLVNENDHRPRVWKNLDRAIASLTRLGVAEARIDLR